MEDENATKSSFLIVISVRVVSEMLFGLVTFPSEMLKVDPLMDSCLLYTSPSPRDLSTSRMPSSA